MNAIRYNEYGSFYIISTLENNVLLGVMSIKYKMFTNMSGRELKHEERSEIEKLKLINK